MRKIARVSCLLKWIAIGFCSILPLVEAGYWMTNGYPFLEPFFKMGALPSYGTKLLAWSDLNELQKFLAFLVNLIPLSFSMASLAFLSRLFAAFEKLDLFAKGNVQLLKRAGWALVWGQICYPFYIALQSLTLTFRNPVGERNISVAIGSNQFEILAIGLSILVASWVFEEAVKIHEEQQGTV
ncbi:MAG: DUF2975 domain-containing protein [Parachlamydiales bacterium]|nr:DUF2975 domain-containing protein [Parachlamydiales bacterium]